MGVVTLDEIFECFSEIILSLKCANGHFLKYMNIIAVRSHERHGNSAGYPTATDEQRNQNSLLLALWKGYHRWIEAVMIIICSYYITWTWWFCKHLDDVHVLSGATIYFLTQTVQWMMFVVSILEIRYHENFDEPTKYCETPTDLVPVPALFTR